MRQVPENGQFCQDHEKLYVGNDAAPEALSAIHAKSYVTKRESLAFSVPAMAATKQPFAAWKSYVSEAISHCILSISL